jgi:hypothetical protein
MRAAVHISLCLQLLHDIAKYETIDGDQLPVLCLRLQPSLVATHIRKMRRGKL